MHELEDRSDPPFVISYFCRTCTSSITVEGPTVATDAAVRTWLSDCHPGVLRPAVEP